ncbi:MAG: DUF433 domain-containing protein [Rhodothermales bacterium]|nr:DUF433 domain-containing protein [Rhodothermales bacterium]
MDATTLPPATPGITEWVPGLVVSDPATRDGVPMIVDSRYSVSDLLRYLGGEMERDEVCDLIGITDDQLREILRWVASVVHDQGKPTPARYVSGLRRQALALADVWNGMLRQPHNSRLYRAAARLDEVAPDLVAAIRRVINHA